MKKCLKIIALVIAIVFVALSLCSCKQLDEMKNNQAVYLDDTKETMEFRGNTYRALPANLRTTFIVDTITGAYVTEKDVPVMVASSYGDEIYFRTDLDAPVIIKRETLDTDVQRLQYSVYGYADVKQDLSETYYCLDSRYDEVVKLGQNPVLDHMMIEGNVFDEKTKDYTWTRGMIDDAVAKGINDALNRDVDETKDVKDDLYYKDEIYLYRCDKDMIAYDEDGIYVVNEVTSSKKPAKYYVYCDSADEHLIYRLIDESCYDSLDKIFEKFARDEENYED